MKIDEFRKLNQDNQILHIGNVWDINSALILQRNGYKALGTSSAAIASSLGYEDGEQMSFDELFQICKQIISKINVPLSVDIEAGYSRDVKQIIKNIPAKNAAFTKNDNSLRVSLIAFLYSSGIN